MSNGKYFGKQNKIESHIGRMLQEGSSHERQPQMPCGKVNSPACEAYKLFNKILTSIDTFVIKPDFPGEFDEANPEILAVAFQDQPITYRRELSKKGIFRTIGEIEDKTLDTQEDLAHSELVEQLYGEPYNPQHHQLIL